MEMNIPPTFHAHSPGLGASLNWNENRTKSGIVATRIVSNCFEDDSYQRKTARQTRNVEWGFFFAGGGVGRYGCGSSNGLGVRLT